MDSPRELAAKLREGHHQGFSDDLRVVCVACLCLWPCTNEKAAAELERGADAIEALEAVWRDARWVNVNRWAIDGETLGKVTAVIQPAASAVEGSNQ